MVTARAAPAIALCSAVLFGASTPFAKLLLGEGISPVLLAGLFYLGSGIGLAALTLARRMIRGGSTEAPLRRSDLPWLALVVFFGGVAGPVLLMIGLATTSGSAAALLLNVEGLATMAIAWIVVRESVDRRLLVGAFAILAGAVVLSWQRDTGTLGFGALAIIGACVAWGIDNNLTRRLSAADPVQIAMIKGLVAGAVNTALALSSGDLLPTAGPLAVAGLVGFIGYGASLV
ncbi:MAG TPA: DMT family transporter, partial [Bauldia sp.]|nr:DMT family transporter [Bauldia sp.]